MCFPPVADLLPSGQLRHRVRPGRRRALGRWAAEEAELLFLLLLLQRLPLLLFQGERFGPARVLVEERAEQLVPCARK